MDILYVTGTSVSKCGNTRYTSGMVGAKVRVIYDETWDGMAKVICFTNGCVQRDVVAISDVVEIPHEVLAEPFKEFKMGFYGSAEKTATPTVWCSVGNILLGTDPNGDETVDPTNPVYIQILNLIGNVMDLKTVCKKDLVCAINEIYELVNTGGNVDEEAIKKLIAEHNVSAEAHNDIRLLITQLTQKFNTFLDSDDQTLDQLTELIQAIKANQGTIEKLTNGKVNVSDIIDNLTTADAKKPLSAAMGMELKRLIDAIKIPSVPTKTSQLQNDSGFITGDDIPAIPEVPSWAMQPQKPEYTADEVGAIADSELQNAIDQALQKAKQSGLFDGKDGATPKFASVKVTTLEPGSKATASITGSTESLILNLGIPRGKDGANGDRGPAGVEGFYSSKSEYNESTCVKYCTQATSWNAGELNEAQGPEWKVPGSVILLAIRCDNGDVYVSIQEVVNSTRLQPKTYWISKKGAQGDPGSGGSGSDISLSVIGASIGQIVEIEEVDENGKPKRWKAVDKPSGGGEKPWRLIGSGTCSGAWGRVVFEQDLSGVPLNLNEAIIYNPEGTGAKKWIHFNGTKTSTFTSFNQLLNIVPGVWKITYGDSSSLITLKGSVINIIGLEFADAKEASTVTVYGRDA